MTIIERCEKEVLRSWTGKQQQATAWLDLFVPHYTGWCLSARSSVSCQTHSERGHQ